MQNFDQPARPRFRPRQEQFTEYSAPDGTIATGVLKLIGVLTLVGYGLLAFYLMDNMAKLPPSTPHEITNTVTVVAVAAFIQGVSVCCLFFVIATMGENLTAIRKNTQHLAGIRAELVTQNAEKPANLQ